MKKNKISAYLLILSAFIAIIFCCGFVNPKTKVYASIEADKSIVNNLVLFKFQDDADDYLEDVSLYKGTMIDFYNQMWNGEDNSIKRYFYDVSNGKVTFETNFLTEKSGKLEFLNLEHNRGFFSPYLSRNSSYTAFINEEGYFEYEIIDTTNRPTNDFTLNLYNTALRNAGYGNYPIDYLYLEEDKHICNVFDCAKFTSTKHDYNDADGICCKCRAEEIVESNSKYELIDTMECDIKRMYLISIIYNEIKSSLGSNIDLDNDGYIDCFSLIANKSSKIKDEWGHILWPHNFSLSFLNYLKSIINNNPLDLSTRLLSIGENSSYATDIENVLIEKMNSTESIKPGEYTLLETEYPLNMVTKSVYDNNIKKIGTFAHELSHLLGLPDYYIYSTSSSAPVGKWSLMCSNSDDIPQYLTSYDRLSLGFLDTTTNIKTISENGYYTLEPVTTNDEQKVVSYRLQNDSNTKQYIYLEYRNGNKNSYDTYLSESGLLVYRIDTNFNGNAYADTKGGYEMMVLRQDSQNVNDAALGEGESLSSEIVLTDGTEWGLTVKVLSKTDDLITFEIIDENLPDKEITLADLDNNETLYNKLKSITGNSKIYYNSLKNVKNLDLSYCNLTNVRFFSSMDLSSLEFLDLTGNNIENSEVSNLIEENPNVKISLLYNSLNISSLSNVIKENQNLLIGFQKFNQEYVVNGTFSLDCIWREEYNNYCILQVNGSSISSCEKITLSSLGKNTIKTLGIVSTSLNIEKNITLLSVSAKENIIFTKINAPSQNPLDYIQIDGIDTSELSFTLGEIDLDVSQGTFSIEIEKSGNLIYTQSVEYRVVVNQISSSVFEDENLYNKLNSMSGYNLNELSFSHLNYIDLSNSNISSVAGLENFVYKENCVINLSSNNLSDLTNLNSVISNLVFDNVAQILLVDNKFSITSNLDTKLVFGIQMLEDTHHYIDTDTKTATQGYHIVTENLSNRYEVVTNDRIGKSYGVIYYQYNGLNDFEGFDLDIRFIYGKVWLTYKVINVEAGSPFQPSALNSLGLLISNYTVETDSVDTSTISTQTIDYRIKDGEVILLTLTQKVVVQDTTAPEITLVGENKKYLKLNSLYTEQGATSEDSFEGILDVTTKYYYTDDLSEDYMLVSNIDTSMGGYYKVQYTAEDSYENKATIERLVIVGDVVIEPIEYLNINYSTLIDIEYRYFTADLFTVKYSLNSQPELDFNGYILSKKSGQNTLTFTFTSEYDLDYTFNFSFNVLDALKPTLELNGYKTQYIHVGNVYNELGAVARDNSTNEVLTSNSGEGQTSDNCIELSKRIYYINDLGTKTYLTQIPSNIIRVYYVSYIAVDNSMNEKEEIRVVNYIYPEVKTLLLDYDSMKVLNTEDFSVVADVSLEKDTLNADDVVYQWYVDGNLVSGKYTRQTKLLIKDTGKHTICVKAINKSLNGESTVISSNEIEVIVMKETLINKYGSLIFIIAGGVVVIAIIGLVFGLRRKSKWY